jgi:hypothetical protein
MQQKLPPAQNEDRYDAAIGVLTHALWSAAGAVSHHPPVAPARGRQLTFAAMTALASIEIFAHAGIVAAGAAPALEPEPSPPAA